MTERRAVYEAVDRERQYQDAKYGTAHDRQLMLIEYLHIAQQELNEAMCAVVDGDLPEAHREALQVIAVLTACLERHGVVERPEMVTAGGES